MSDRSLSTSVEAISDWLLIPPASNAPSVSMYDLVFQAESGESVSVSSDAQSFLIEVPDEAAVIVDCGSKQIQIVDVGPDMAPADVRQFIDDHVAPRILSHSGAFVLHAGSVQTGDSCILIAGNTGNGKSTLTGSLDAAGWPMMGDDAVLFSSSDAGLAAQSTYRRLCLLPDSLREIVGIEVGSDPAQDYKHRVPLEVATQHALPVAAIFVLADSGTSAPKLTAMSASSACLALVANSFALDPSDQSRALTRLQQATGIANEVPVYSLDYPRTYQTLPRVRELIATELARLGVATPSGEPPR